MQYFTVRRQRIIIEVLAYALIILVFTSENCHKQGGRGSIYSNELASNIHHMLQPQNVSRATPMKCIGWTLNNSRRKYIHV